MNSENKSVYGIFINKNNGKKLVYYPCPKNANSSAKLFFAKHLGVDSQFIFISDNIPQNKQTIDDFNNKENLINFLPSKQPFSEVNNVDIKCCIIRDPVKRFISAYKNRILFHKDREFKDHHIDRILEKLEEGNFENRHFLPQNYFLGKNIDYYNFTADVEKIDIFQNKVNDFFDKTITFPKIQTGGKEFEISLSNNQITKIKKIYKEDYDFLKI